MFQHAGNIKLAEDYFIQCMALCKNEGWVNRELVTACINMTMICMVKGDEYLAKGYAIECVRVKEIIGEEIDPWFNQFLDRENRV